LADESVEVADISPDDGTVKMIRVPLSRVTSDQVRTAFSPYGMRPAKEQQRLAIEAASPKKQKSRPVDSAPKIDAHSKQLRLGRTYFTAAGVRVETEALVAALSDFYGVDIQGLIDKKNGNQS
jgi:hypothetical protein